MSKEHHQALHLRYLDQHEAHPDRAEIAHRRRQRRLRHPPRQTEERQDDVISAGSERDDDDESLLDVRRYGKCFYITMAPENFVDSPPIKQQYLDYLAAEKFDVTDNGNMAEDYNPEDFYTWAFEPCLPLFETVAPAPKQNFKTTIHDFLHPEVFHYSLRAVDGELTPVQTSE